MGDILTPSQNGDNAACIDCCKKAGDQLHVFEDTNTCLVTNTTSKMVHLHFGVPTTSNEQSTQQAAFIEETVLNQLYQKNPDTHFFVIADFGRLDDSTAPSKEALKTYNAIIHHQQTSHVVCHGVSTGMNGIIHLLTLSPKLKKKISVVDNAQKATERYQQWNQETASA
jgi:hypothetical protein